MKQDLYDTTFSVYEISSTITTDVNGDSIKSKHLLGTFPCQIDNLNGDDAVRYGKNNELATHVIFCDTISNLFTADECQCQNMQLDISFIAKNLGGLTQLTRGIEIYCIFRGWVPLATSDDPASSSSSSSSPEPEPPGPVLPGNIYQMVESDPSGNYPTDNFGVSITEFYFEATGDLLNDKPRYVGGPWTMDYIGVWTIFNDKGGIVYQSTGVNPEDMIWSSESGFDPMYAVRIS